VEGTGTPVVSGDKVYGYKVLYDEMYIVIDADIDGLTVEELEAYLKLEYRNSDSFSMTVQLTAAGEKNGLVGTGAVVTATASSSYTQTSATVTYTIIILGDLNGDGMNKMIDSTFIGQAVVESRELNELQTIAANVNNNGRVDIGDAARNARKIFYTDEYKSLLAQDGN